MTPVHYDRKQKAWFFWTETWADKQGPFKSKDEAEKACSVYAKWLTSGRNK